MHRSSWPGIDLTPAMAGRRRQRQRLDTSEQKRRVVRCGEVGGGYNHHRANRLEGELTGLGPMLLYSYRPGTHARCCNGRPLSCLLPTRLRLSRSLEHAGLVQPCLRARQAAGEPAANAYAAHRPPRCYSLSSLSSAGPDRPLGLPGNGMSDLVPRPQHRTWCQSAHETRRGFTMQPKTWGSAPTRWLPIHRPGDT